MQVIIVSMRKYAHTWWLLLNTALKSCGLRKKIVWNDNDNAFLLLWRRQCDQVFHWKNCQLLLKNRQICRYSNKVIFQSFTKKKIWRFFAKKMSPKTSKNHQNGEKSPHLVTLDGGHKNVGALNFHRTSFVPFACIKFAVRTDARSTLRKNKIWKV